jgi:hypothetical protein
MIIISGIHHLNTCNLKHYSIGSNNCQPPVFFGQFFSFARSSEMGISTELIFDIMMQW